MICTSQKKVISKVQLKAQLSLTNYSWSWRSTSKPDWWRTAESDGCWLTKRSLETEESDKLSYTFLNIYTVRLATWEVPVICIVTHALNSTSWAHNQKKQTDMLMTHSWWPRPPDGWCSDGWTGPWSTPPTGSRVSAALCSRLSRSWWRPGSLFSPAASAARCTPRQTRLRQRDNFLMSFRISVAMQLSFHNIIGNLETKWRVVLKGLFHCCTARKLARLTTCCHAGHKHRL